MSFIAPQRSLPSAEERIRLLEEELEGANFLIDELKRQLYQANEDYRSNLRKKSATLIAWQNAYEELEKKWTSRKKEKVYNHRECQKMALYHRKMV
ncbi:unnamed protein product [Nippostrongylus brasiliensis]|uniref:VPS37 C-terminal domain-containing protein n=1 Tax=Nippostrongylus brasiliensis TaxID=27835 RepID=A0A0N4YKL5_NIPBR|nr:hypothetical protein Q1695_000610 [Nippostrongylus brasiliensis]VDL81251.1 unnamed protein product [Nippostrongylus brasiliensis]